MIMKEFEFPEIEVAKFSVQDMITTSDEWKYREDELPVG